MTWRQFQRQKMGGLKMAAIFWQFLWGIMMINQMGYPIFRDPRNRKKHGGGTGNSQMDLWLMTEICLPAAGHNTWLMLATQEVGYPKSTPSPGCSSLRQ